MGVMNRREGEGRATAVGRTERRRLVAALAMAIALAAARPAAAIDAPEYANDFGLGVGTVLCDLVYMPLKVVYATLGGITGGFAFVLTGGRTEIASAIWRPSLGGTYVLTPGMLRGDEQIYFSGTTEEPAVSPDERRTAPPREEPLGDRDRGPRGEAY